MFTFLLIVILYIEHGVSEKNSFDYWTENYFTAPFDTWHQCFSCILTIKYMHKSIVDNKVKQFKMKLLHNIIATNLNLFTWKLKDCPLCIYCNEVEDYEHFFIKCRALSTFWSDIQTVFKRCGIQKHIKNINHIVLGYKIDQKEYNIVNIVLSQISYCIYKTYFMCERRTKPINIMYHLYNDLIVIQTHLKINKGTSLRF